MILDLVAIQRRRKTTRHTHGRRSGTITPLAAVTTVSTSASTPPAVISATTLTTSSFFPRCSLSRYSSCRRCGGSIQIKALFGIGRPWLKVILAIAIRRRE